MNDEEEEDEYEEGDEEEEDDDDIEEIQNPAEGRGHAGQGTSVSLDSPCSPSQKAKSCCDSWDSRMLRRSIPSLSFQCMCIFDPVR